MDFCDPSTQSTAIYTTRQSVKHAARSLGQPLTIWTPTEKSVIPARIWVPFSTQVRTQLVSVPCKIDSFYWFMTDSLSFLKRAMNPKQTQTMCPKSRRRMKRMERRSLMISRMILLTENQKLKPLNPCWIMTKFRIQLHLQTAMVITKELFSVSLM